MLYLFHWKYLFAEEQGVTVLLSDIFGSCVRRLVRNVLRCKCLSSFHFKIFSFLQQTDHPFRSVERPTPKTNWALKPIKGFPCLIVLARLGEGPKGLRRDKKCQWNYPGKQSNIYCVCLCLKKHRTRLACHIKVK